MNPQSQVRCVQKHREDARLGTMTMTKLASVIIYVKGLLHTTPYLWRPFLETSQIVRMPDL